MSEASERTSEAKCPQGAARELMLKSRCGCLSTKFIAILAPLLLSFSLCAMPTQEELTKAAPLIQELMRDDYADSLTTKYIRLRVRPFWANN